MDRPYNNPYKVIYKVKNNNLRYQYYNYIFVGDVPDKLKDILIKIKDLTLTQTLKTLTNDELLTIEEYYGTKWYFYFFSKHHLLYQIDDTSPDYALIVQKININHFNIIKSSLYGTAGITFDKEFSRYNITRLLNKRKGLEYKDLKRETRSYSMETHSTSTKNVFGGSDNNRTIHDIPHDIPINNIDDLNKYYIDNAEYNHQSYGLNKQHNAIINELDSDDHLLQKITPTVNPVDVDINACPISLDDIENPVSKKHYTSNDINKIKSFRFMKSLTDIVENNTVHTRINPLVGGNDKFDFDDIASELLKKSKNTLNDDTKTPDTINDDLDNDETSYNTIDNSNKINNHDIDDLSVDLLNEMNNDIDYNVDDLNDSDNEYIQEPRYNNKQNIKDQILINDILKNEFSLKKHDVLEFDTSRDDSLYNQVQTDIYKKYYIFGNYINHNDTIKVIKQKICYYIKNKKKYGNTIPSRQYLWVEQTIGALSNITTLGNIWRTGVDLLKIDYIPKENIRIYDELRDNIKKLYNDIKMKSLRIQREKTDNKILSDYDKFMCFNEIYYIDIYNEIALSYKRTPEEIQNLNETYVKLYYPDIQRNAIDNILTFIDETNKSEETKLIENTYNNITNELLLSSSIFNIINTTGITYTNKISKIIDTNYIIQAKITIDLKTQNDQNFNRLELFKIFNEIELSNTYIFIQVVQLNRKMYFKFNKEYIENMINNEGMFETIKKWFDKKNFGITFKIVDNDKYMSATFNSMGNLTYKLHWTERDQKIYDDIFNSYKVIKDLIKDINKTSINNKLIIPEDSEFNTMFLTTISKFKFKKNIEINHNDLSDFSRLSYPYFALVIEPKKRISKIHTTNKTKSKYGTYLRYKRISNYENNTKIEDQIKKYMQYYDASKTQIINVICKQFNLTDEKSNEYFNNVLKTYPNIKKKIKKLMKIDETLKYKTPGIDISIQGKTPEKYKIRISGVKDLRMLTDINNISSILLFLYYEIYIEKNKDLLWIKDILKKLNSVAERRSIVSDVVKYENKDDNEINVDIDKFRIGYKPTKGQSYYKRSCQNSGKHSRRRPQQFSDDNIEKIIEAGYKLNKSSGVFEKIITQDGKKIILKAVELKAIDAQGNYTQNKIYYTCDPVHNGKHMYIGFLTKSKNPYGEDMPCCFKKEQDLTRKSESTETIEKRNKNEQFYILQDTIKLPENRLGLLPKLLDYYFNELRGKNKKIVHHILISTKSNDKKITSEYISNAKKITKLHEQSLQQYNDNNKLYYMNMRGGSHDGSRDGSDKNNLEIMNYNDDIDNTFKKFVLNFDDNDKYSYITGGRNIEKKNKTKLNKQKAAKEELLTSIASTNQAQIESIMSNKFKDNYYFKLSANTTLNSFISTIANCLDIKYEDVGTKILDVLTGPNKDKIFNCLNNGKIKLEFITLERYIKYLKESSHLSINYLIHLFTLPGVLLPNGLNIYVFNKINKINTLSLYKYNFNLININTEEIQNINDPKRKNIILCADTSLYFIISSVKHIGDKKDPQLHITKTYNFNDEIMLYVQDYINNYNDVTLNNNGFHAKLLYTILQKYNYNIKCQFIDIKNNTKYLITEIDNEQLLIPTLPSGSVYNIDIIDDNIDQYILTFNKTLKLLNMLIKNKEFEEYAPYKLQYDKTKNNSYRIQSILLYNNLFIPIKKEYISDTKSKELELIKIPYYTKIDKHLQLLKEKNYDKVLTEKEIDDRIKVVNYMKYKTESYELFKYNISNYLTKDLKSIIHNIIDNEVYTYDEKQTLLKEFFFKLIDNKKLNNIYTRLKKPTDIKNNDIDNIKPSNIFYIFDYNELNKHTDLINYKQDNIRKVCTKLNKKSNNPHCYWVNNNCVFSMTYKMAIYFINLISNDLLSNNIKLKEILQEDGYYLSSIINDNYYIEQEGQKVLIKHPQQKENPFIQYYTANNYVIEQEDKAVESEIKTDINALKILNNQYNQQILSENNGIMRAYTNCLNWIINYKQNIHIKNLGFTSIKQNKIMTYLKSIIVDFIQDYKNIDYINKLMKEYNYKQDDFIIKFITNSDNIENEKIYLTILNKINHIPISILDNFNEVIYTIGDMQKNNDKKNIICIKKNNMYSIISIYY